MRTRVCLIFLLLGVALLPGLAAAEPRPDAYTLPGGAVFPEGVAFEQDSGFFYVSSTTDGTIFRGDLGSTAAEAFLPAGTDGRTSATGLETANGLLYVSGGGTGKMFIYETETGALVEQFAALATPTFINDVAVTNSGDAFFTDSLTPSLYRVFDEGSGLELERFIDFTGTALTYEAGFNANGIVATPDGRYLLIIQSNTGELFRVDLSTKAVVEVELGGAALTAGDGLELRGRNLYVVRNSLGGLGVIRQTGDFATGELLQEVGDPSFRFPTTAAIARGRLLVVNSQFNQRAAGTQELPFTLSSVPIP